MTFNVAQYEQPGRYTLLFDSFVGVGRKFGIRRTLDRFLFDGREFLLLEEIVKKIHVNHSFILGTRAGFFSKTYSKITGWHRESNTCFCYCTSPIIGCLRERNIFREMAKGH